MKTLVTISALAMAITLTACGGGGGGDTAGGTPPAAKSELLTDANQPSPYLVGSPEKKNFDELNRVRVAGGFGAMQYEEVMSKAAAAHTLYSTSDGLITHNETVGQPGFTGATPQDRCNAAAGGVFKFVCGEGGYAASLAPSQTIATFNVLEGYSLATGHLQAVLDYTGNRGGLRIAGAIISDFNSGFGYIYTGWVAASGAPKADSAHGIVGVYPFNNMTAVGIGQGTPGVPFTLQTAPGGQQYWSGYGISILAQFPTSVNPVVTSFTLRKEGATVDVPTRVHEAGTYNGTEPTNAGWAILIPTVVLDANSRYTVKFVGSHGGVATEKTWSFTTGSAWGTKMGG